MAKKTAQKEGGVGGLFSTPLAIIQHVIAILIAIGGPQLFSLYAPPTDNLGAIRVLLSFCGAVAWILALLTNRGLAKIESFARFANRIFFIALFVLPLGVVLVVQYINQWEEYAVEYNGVRVLTGAALTPKGKEYFVKYPDNTRLDAISSAGGNANTIWTENSISDVRTGLLSRFSLSATLAVFSVVLLFYLTVGNRLAPPSNRST